jgi:hypothetical protein
MNVVRPPYNLRDYMLQIPQMHLLVPKSEESLHKPPAVVQ